MSDVVVSKNLSQEQMYALTADEKFELVARRISFNYESFLQFYFMLQRKAVNDDNVTIRLNTKEGAYAILEYNPTWVQAIHPVTLTALVLIEILRLILHHCTKRKLNPINICWESSNITCAPFNVTKILNELNNVNVKQKGSPAVRITDLFPSINTFKELIPNDFDPNKDMYLERIFNIMNQNQEQFNNIMNNTYGASKQQNNSNQGQNNQNSQNGQDGQSQNNDQDGQNGQDNNQDGQNGKPENEEEALKQHFGHSAQTATDNWGENEIIDQQVATAVNKADTSAWANLPGSLAQQILAANVLIVDPRVALRRFTTSIFSDAMTFSRMHYPRRYGEKWIGHMPGTRHEQKAKVLIAIDCSGSMPDSEISKACMVVNNFVKHAEVNYCFWDGACGPILEQKQTKNNFNLSGRGCTNPQCVIDKIIKEKLHYDGIIYITDCQFDWPKPNIKSTIFIIQSDNADDIPDWCKYSMTMNDVNTVYDNM